MSKSSKVVKLVLVASLFGTYNSSLAQNNGNYNGSNPKKRLHLRGDSTDKYTKVNSRNGRFYYYHFFPMGTYMNNHYMHTGYSSSAVSSSSYAHPRNAYSPRSTRGGFGRSSGFRVGS